MVKQITKDEALAALRDAKKEIIKRGGAVSGHGTSKDKDGNYFLTLQVLSKNPDFDATPFRQDGVLIQPKIRDIPELAARR